MVVTRPMSLRLIEVEDSGTVSGLRPGRGFPPRPRLLDPREHVGGQCMCPTCQGALPSSVEPPLLKGPVSQGLCREETRSTLPHILPSRTDPKSFCVFTVLVTVCRHCLRSDDS